MRKNVRPRVAVQLDVSGVASSGTGTVYGIIVGQVSPVKTSKKQLDVKFLEGQISDGVKTIRLVSFEPILRCKVEEEQKAKRGVALQILSREATTMIILNST